MEVRSVRLQDLDFDREQLKVVQGKGKRDRYVPLSKHLIRGLKTYIEPKSQNVSLQPKGIAGGDFDSRYSQRGVQWESNKPVKQLGLQGGLCAYASAHFATFTRRRTRYYHT
jgi:integrase